MSALFGINIVSSPFAVTLHVEHRLERVGPPWKRRNRWRVRRHEARRPACLQLADGTLVMHPTLFYKLKEQAR
jgi:hypothetical protein